MVKGGLTNVYSKTINYDLVGNNLKRLLKEKKLPQYKVEELVGMGRGYLTNVVNNKHAVNVWLLQEIAVALDVDVREFFKPEE